jgi:Nodulation protein Z (NodZ)
VIRPLRETGGLTARRRLNTLLARYRWQSGVLPIDIHGVLGLGARLEWCLEIAAYCEESGLIPRFRFTYPGSKADYFSELFLTDTEPGPHPRAFIRINSIIELDLGKDYNAILTMESASRLAARCLRVRESIAAEVDAFCERRLGDRQVLGLHYRGTDKVEESPLVPYETVYRNVDRYFELFPETEAVFVATDDARFLHDISLRRLQVEVIARDDAFRSSDGGSVHKSAAADRSAVNRDALVNCLILSRCDAMMKTPSLLSGCSKVFNPALPVVMIGLPYEGNLWFPETAIVGANLFDPLP